MAPTDEQLAHKPVTGAVAVHGDVLDSRIAAAISKGDPPIEHFSHHKGFSAALFETAQVNQPGADDLRLVDRGDARHRYKDPFFSWHFDDDAHHMRGAAAAAGEHHNIAQPAQTVPQGIEDVQSK